jgi:hypothetical protein
MELPRFLHAALRLRASLAGRSRHEAQGSAKVVGVRFPDPAQDTHLSHQLILPPLSTGPDQTLTREALDLAISGLAYKIWPSVKIAVALNDVPDYTHFSI